MRFGRLPHDPVALAAAHKHVLGVSLPQTVLDRGAIPFQPGLDGNDIYGDCTCVSIANAIRARAVLNGFQANVSSTAAVTFFATCAGHPSDLVAVDGLVYLDVINRQASEGFPTGFDTLFGIPGTVDPSRASLADAIGRFGSVGVGVTLHQSDLAAFQAGAVWDDGSGDVAGGHVMLAWDYTGLGDTDTVRVATWGRLIRVTWRWLERAADEAHALDFPQETAA